MGLFKKFAEPSNVPCMVCGFYIKCQIRINKIYQELGFKAKLSVERAVKDLKKAFDEGKIPNPFEDNIYYNIKMMQAVNLSNLNPNT